MNATGWEQLLFVGAATAILAPLLGRYLAASFHGGRAPGDRIFLPVERAAWRIAPVIWAPALGATELTAIGLRLAKNSVAMDSKQRAGLGGALPTMDNYGK